MERASAESTKIHNWTRVHKIIYGESWFDSSLDEAVVLTTGVSGIQIHEQIIIKKRDSV